MWGVSATGREKHTQFYQRSFFNPHLNLFDIQTNMLYRYTANESECQKHQVARINSNVYTFQKQKKT